MNPAFLVATLLGLCLGAGLLSWGIFSSLTSEAGAQHANDSVSSDMVSSDSMLSEQRMTTAAPHVGAERGRRMVNAGDKEDGASTGITAAADARSGEAVQRWVRLESVPSGAMVWEGTARLGHTPLQLAVPADALSARNLELRSDGFLATPWELHPDLSGEAVVIELNRTSFAPR